jgi:hypothetical protein
MTAIAVTAAKVAVVKPSEAKIVPYIAGATITAGQAVYRYTDGTAKLADADGSGTYQPRGIALNGGGAGQAIDVLEDGDVYGFTLTSMNADAIAYLSNTAGGLATAAGSHSAAVGRVVCLTDKDATKVLHVFAQNEADWS